jgi:hypothetical protein
MKVTRSKKRNGSEMPKRFWDDRVRESDQVNAVGEDE